LTQLNSSGKISFTALYPSQNIFRKGLKMKVLLLKDVYKLGRAGDVKKVADGYGRNFLIPQGFATLATPSSLKQAEFIRAKAATMRAALNSEMSGVAESLANITLTFAGKAGETGKLYGSITSQMVADALEAKTGVKIDKRQVEMEPIRALGEHAAHVRLTIDLTPAIKILVHREGEIVQVSEPTTAVEEPVEELPAE
jgi:large subunit ribosomal protein L9